MVQDGSTIIMAGLKKEEKTHSKKGIPGLMNVPYLGNLFSSTADAITATEIVILITPHVIKGTDTYNKDRGTIKPPKAYDGNVKMPAAQ